jgi:hypothetical protein
MAISSEFELLIGVGVLTLGILAISGINALVLTAVAFIAVGASGILKSLTVGRKLARTFLP